MSRALRLVSFGMRWLIKPLLARAGRVGAARCGLVLATIGFPKPFGITVARQLAHPPLWRFRAKAVRRDKVILFFHGGAYIVGSPWTHRGLLGRLARATKAEVVAPDYRLAPECPAPAAYDDALRAFEILLAEGLAPDQIVVAGDSAGGGLAAALVNGLAERGIAIGGMILLSPWTDLTMSGASIVTRAKQDPIFPVAPMRGLIDMVKGPLAADDLRISPLFGAFPVACPTLILTGEAEILLDDSQRLAALLRSKGGRVDLHIEAAAPHVYPFLAPYVPEARAAFRQMASFFNTL